jgi:hypothetical protein
MQYLPGADAAREWIAVQRLYDDANRELLSELRRGRAERARITVLAAGAWPPTVVSRIFRTFDQATAPVCMTCGW